jgi:hypothetical protein
MKAMMVRPVNLLSTACKFTAGADAVALSELERPIHLSKFPVLAAMPKRFCNERETSELFRLGSIFLYLRLHGTYSGCPLQRLTCRCKTLFRAAIPQLGRPPALLSSVRPMYAAFVAVQESAFGNKSSLKAKPKTDHDLLSMARSA